MARARPHTADPLCPPSGGGAATAAAAVGAVVATATAFGASLAGAEVVGSLVQGGHVPLTACVLLAAYDVGACLLLALVVAAAGWRSRPESGAVVALWVSAACVLALQLAYALVATPQDWLPSLSLRHPSRLVAAALAVGMTSIVALRLWTRRRPRPGSDVEAQVAILIVAAPILAWGHLALGRVLSRPGLGRAVTVLVAEGVMCLAVAEWATGRRADARKRQAGRAVWAVAVALGVLAAAASLARGAPERSYVRRRARVPATLVPRDRPNVVLVVLDTVRARNLSCYGYPRPTTPNLDRLSVEGVRYTRCTTTAPWTLPAHASLFTGLLTARHGADFALPAEAARETGTRRLDDRFDTLAELLGRAGYTTAGFSANGLLGGPSNLDQGFELFEVTPRRAFVDFGPHAPMWHRLRARLPYPLVVYPWAELFPGPHHKGAAVTDRAVEWILSERPPARPYFLFLKYLDAHAAHAPRRRIRRLWPQWPIDQRFPPEDLPPAAIAELLSGTRLPTREELIHLTALYDGALDELDREVGRLFAFLRGRADYDDTWVIVTADHGEALGEHHLVSHGVSLYEELLRVPLIIKYPARAGMRVAVSDSRPVQIDDIAPTILDALGLPLPPTMDGVPIRAGRTEAFAEASQSMFLGSLRPRRLRSIASGRYKLIVDDAGPEELYDLEADPLELRDLSRALPDVVKPLRERLLAVTARKATFPLPSREDEHLKALGYVH